MAAKESAFQLDARIRIFPDPILRSPAKKITEFDEALKKTANRMALFMRASGGQGIAAQQCGLLGAILLFEHEDKIVPAINPRLLEYSEEVVVEAEGCLSLPGLEFQVPRFEAVRAEAQDLEGSAFTMELVGNSARVLQHEMDHLHGRIVFDYLPAADKISLLSQIPSQ